MLPCFVIRRLLVIGVYRHFVLHCLLSWGDHCYPHSNYSGILVCVADYCPTQLASYRTGCMPINSNSNSSIRPLKRPKLGNNDNQNSKTTKMEQPKKPQRQRQKPHPMVPVPDAIRIVLRETARVLLTPKAIPEEPSLQISVATADAPYSSDREEILGKVLEEDVRMTEPGYPPYNASIMDGYAIRTSEYSNFLTAQQQEQQQQQQPARSPPSLDATTTAGGKVAWTHHVVDKVYAGDDQGPKLSAKVAMGAGGSPTDYLPSAYYITTGAVVPETYDCVVPIEECDVSEDRQFIQIQPSAATIEPNTWIRPIGCDIPAGSVVLPKGHTMDPVALGLLQQSGADTISVKRPLVIGVLSTGNELLLGSSSNSSSSKKDSSSAAATAAAAAAAAQPGKIPDVNRPILLNMLSTFGKYCQPLDLGNERDDDVQAMARTIDRALAKCDVIIATGGISMGETDIVEQVLVEHCGGTLHFGRMNMKPGKPTTFVTIPKGDAVRLVFAMPGNPVSATVCTQLLVRPCLDLLFHGVPTGIGDSNTASTDESDVITEESLNEIVEGCLVHREIEAKLTHDVTLDQQRPEYHRVAIQRSPDGASLEVTTTGNQRSSRLISCRDAQALLVLPVGTAAKPKALAGETYPVLLLSELRGWDQLQLKDAKHLQKRGRQASIAVVEVVPKEMAHLSKLEETCARVENALSGAKSGQAAIVSKKTFSDPLDRLYTAIIDSNDADLVVVSCVSFEGSYRYHLDVVSALRKRLEKPAKALALQARQGAASEDSTAALFEVVAGFAPEKQGTMVICLPDIGVAGGLGNVRGLMKHAKNVARGKPHNHHHTHQHHDHGKPQ